MGRCLARAVIGAALAAAGAPQAVAQNAAGVAGYVTVATAYWKRGLSQTYDAPALQAGVDYQHPAGWLAGGALANVDYAYESAAREPREIEAVVYGGYHRRRGPWSWTLMAGRYVYPGTDGGYDYDEIAVSVGFRNRLFVTTSYSDDFYSYGRSARNTELSMSLPLPADFELSAALGRFDLDLSAASKFNHWNFGASKVVRRVALDLRYYESDYASVTTLGDPDGDRVVFSTTYAWRAPGF